jgi:hypothetical protein
MIASDDLDGQRDRAVPVGLLLDACTGHGARVAAFPRDR